MDLLYPNDSDQTIVLRDIVMEDAGIYNCESANGDKLSTINLAIEGMFFSFFHILHCCGLNPFTIIEEKANQQAQISFLTAM